NQGPAAHRGAQALQNGVAIAGAEWGEGTVDHQNFRPLHQAARNVDGSSLGFVEQPPPDANLGIQPDAIDDWFEVELRNDLAHDLPDALLRSRALEGNAAEQDVVANGRSHHELGWVVELDASLVLPWQVTHEALAGAQNACVERLIEQAQAVPRLDVSQRKRDQSGARTGGDVRLSSWLPDDIEELAIVLHLACPDERVAREEWVPGRQVGEYFRR